MLILRAVAGANTPKRQIEPGTPSRSSSCGDSFADENRTDNIVIYPQNCTNALLLSLVDGSSAWLPMNVYRDWSIASAQVLGSLVLVFHEVIKSAGLQLEIPAQPLVV